MKFTPKQIEVVYKTLVKLDDCNTKIGSDCRIENIETFEDGAGNFYMRYLSTYNSIEGVTIDTIYVMVDSTGKQSVLNYTYNNKKELEAFFATLTPNKF